MIWQQGLSQDIKTGCPKLAIVKSLGVQIFKGDHNILRFQPFTCIEFIKIRHNILICLADICNSVLTLCKS